MGKVLVVPPTTPMLWQWIQLNVICLPVLRLELNLYILLSVVILRGGMIVTYGCDLSWEKVSGAP